MNGSVVFAKWRQCVHTSNACFLGPITRVHVPNGIDRFSCFCSAHGRHSLYFTMGHPFPPQNCPFAWGIWTPSNTWFFRPTGVHNPNGIFISSAVFAGLTIVTERQTTTLLHVCNNRPHLRTAMRPNNIVKVKKINVKFFPSHTDLWQQ